MEVRRDQESGVSILKTTMLPSMCSQSWSKTPIIRVGISRRKAPSQWRPVCARDCRVTPNLVTQENIVTEVVRRSTPLLVLHLSSVDGRRYFIAYGANCASTGSAQVLPRQCARRCNSAFSFRPSD